MLQAKETIKKILNGAKQILSRNQNKRSRSWHLHCRMYYSSHTKWERCQQPCCEYPNPNLMFILLMYFIISPF